MLQRLDDTNTAAVCNDSTVTSDCCCIENCEGCHVDILAQFCTRCITLHEEPSISLALVPLRQLTRACEKRYTPCPPPSPRRLKVPRVWGTAVPRLFIVFKDHWALQGTKHIGLKHLCILPRDRDRHHLR
jgi:hypothetical protein